MICIIPLILISIDVVVFFLTVAWPSKRDDILQAPLMFNKAKTTKFSHTITVRGNQMRYQQTTVVDIYDKQSYDHMDVNTLQRQG